MDKLLDRDCAILDGKCDCKRIGNDLPFCKKYGTLKALEKKNGTGHGMS